MAFIPKSLLLQILFPKKQEKTNAPTIQHRASGPGQLDTWQLLEGNDTPWVTRENAPVKQPTLKIVFSHALAEHLIPTSFELALINGLVKHFDVYYWLGPNLQVENFERIHSANDFWNNRASCVSAKAGDVKENIANQGVALDEYAVLDFAAYQHLLTACDHLFSHEEKASDFKMTDAHTIDLSGAPDNIYKKIKDGVDFSCIDTVRIDNPRFSEKQTADAIDEDSSTIVDIVNTLPVKKVTLSLHNHAAVIHSNDAGAGNRLHRSNNFNLPAFLNQVINNNLAVKATFTSVITHLRLPTNCKTLAMNSSETSQMTRTTMLAFYAKSPETNLLEELTITGFNVICFLLDARTPLRKLHISSLGMSTYKFPDLPFLEELYLESNTLESLDLSALPKLKRLHVKGCINLEAIKLAADVKLDEMSTVKRLLIPKKQPGYLRKIECEITDNPDSVFAPTGLHQLNEIVLNKVTRYKLDLTHCPELKSVSLGNFSHVRELHLPPSLVKLNICNHYHPVCLDLRAYTQLKELYLDNTLYTSLLLPDNCQLTILSLTNCHELKNPRLDESKKLKTITLKRNKLISHLDLSVQPDLASVSISECNNLRRVYFNEDQVIPKLSLMNNENLTIYSLPNINRSDYSIIHGVGINMIVTPHAHHTKIVDSHSIDTSVMADSNEYTTTLHLVNCTFTAKELGRFKNVRRLILNNCKNLTESLYASLAQLEFLESITIDDSDIETLKLPKTCLQISVSNCWRLRSLNLLAATQAQYLSVANCEKLKEIEFPKNCQLRILILFKIPIFSFEHYSYLMSSLPVLEKLYFISDLNRAIGIYATNLPHLRELHIQAIETNHMRTFRLVVKNLPRLAKFTVQMGGGEITAFEVNLNASNHLLDLSLEVPPAQRYNASMRTKPFQYLRNINISHSPNGLDLVKMVPHSCNKQYNIQITDKANVNKHPAPAPRNLTSSTSSSVVTQQIPQTQVSREQLNLRNETSAVSRISLSDIKMSLTPDARTGTAADYQARGDMTLTVIGNPTPNTDDYRLCIIDGLSYTPATTTTPAKLIFGQKMVSELSLPGSFAAFDQSTIQRLRDQTLSATTHQLGHLKLDLIPGERYPLATDWAQLKNEIELYSNPPNAVKLIWVEAHQQHYIRSTSRTQVAAELLFYVKRNINYKNSTLSSHYKQSYIDSVLPSALIPILTSFIAKHPPLYFLTDTQLPLAAKVRKLIQYCSEYTIGSLAVTPTNDVDILLQTIIEKKGSCRHRAKVFFILARFLCIPVSMVCSEQHVFLNIPTDANLFSVDLGGGQRLDLTPENLRQNVFDALPKTTATTSTTSTTSTTTVIDEEAEWEKTYTDQFNEHASQIEIKTIAQLIDPRLENLVIELSSSRNPLDFYSCFVNQLPSNTDNKCLYIHDAKDLKKYFKSLKLENSNLTSYHGPLHSIITSSGMVVINWSHFSIEEIASYMSVMDRIPTLLGVKISPHTRVIGLIKPDTETCSAFMSRCKRVTLHEDFFNFSSHAPAQTSKQPVIEIDLFHSHHWREKLLAHINFKHQDMQLCAGKLIQALNTCSKLVIYNPPKDKEFTLLLARLQKTRKLLYNGSMLQVPPDFTVTIAKKSHPVSLSTVKLSNITSAIKDKQRTYLHLNNLHQCYSSLVIDKTKQTAETSTKENILSRYNNEVLYITENFTKSDWQELLYFIKTHYPTKPFHFVLAPGIVIESIAENHEPPSTTHSVYISNDPDQLSLELNASHPNSIIYDVTPQSSIQQLIYDIAITPPTHSTKLKFTLSEKYLLAALKAGKTVILNGQLSPSLFQQLLPLLDGHDPHIMVNGQRISGLKGKLISVQPTSALSALPVIAPVIKNYSLADYALLLTEKERTTLPVLTQFTQFANKLPHSGIGRPAPLQLTFSNIKRMIHAIQDKRFHKHNPIKGLVLYDYPRNSLDYAYLNVMAKVIICPDDAAPTNLKKLRQLIPKHPNSTADIKNMAWKLLNCFNGKEINELFFPAGSSRDNPAEITALFNTTTAFPELTDAVLTRLLAKVTARLTHSDSALPKTDHALKREQMLANLLYDPHTTLIILKGAPGVGKTHTVTALKDKLGFNYYDVNTQILNWLEDTSDKPKVLLLDEGNMAEPGTWNFLKGLTRDSKTIIYNGKEYHLTDKHKIIVTANPESYPNRHYHGFFQNYGETIYYSMPDLTYLENNTINVILDRQALPRTHAKQLLKAYELIQTYNPTFVYSIRDLENLVYRFSVLCKYGNGSLFEACIGEFSGNIADVKKRKQFIDALAQELHVTTPAAQPEALVISPHCIIPSEKHYLVLAVEQDLLMREHSEYYRSSLLDGSSGIGKSNLYIALLEKHGFTRDNPNPRKRYYEISAGDQSEVKTILLRAFKEGSVVIFNELNLDTQLQKLLQDLLSNTDSPLTQIDRQPGFLVLASQNPGRHTQSRALRNRLHMSYMEPYSKEGLEQIAKAKGVAKPSAYVRAYEKCSAVHQALNTRAFFQVLPQAIATIKPAPSKNNLPS